MSTRFLFSDHDSLSVVGDSNDRLRQAREKAGFSSARSAAMRFHWTPSTYGSHENGQTPVPTKAAELYARAFKVSAGWLLTGEGDDKNRNIVRVMGRIGAGAGIVPEEEQIPPEGLFEVEVKFPLPDTAIAFVVDGTSMFPRYDPGDVVICLNRDPPRDPADLIGLEAVVKTSKGARYLKRIRPGARRGLYDLHSHNDPEPIRNVRIAWASEVFTAVPANQSKTVIGHKRQR